MPSTDFNEPPAMGERRARLGYGAQDRLAAELILDALKSPSFHAVRLADLEGGQVDDFVLVWEKEVCGNSVKWTGTGDTLSWADLCGATEPLITQLAEGWKTLRKRYGPEVEGLIHVHHLVPISSVGRSTSVDPIRDLRPVCPNCHAVIHSAKHLRTVGQVQRMIRQNDDT